MSLLCVNQTACMSFPCLSAANISMMSFVRIGGWFKILEHGRWRISKSIWLLCLRSAMVLLICLLVGVLRGKILIYKGITYPPFSICWSYWDVTLCPPISYCFFFFFSQYQKKPIQSMKYSSTTLILENKIGLKIT